MARAKSLKRGTATRYHGHRQQGGVSVEYCVATLMVLAALFLPLGGEGSMSGVDLLLQGLRNFQMHTTYLLSLP